VTNDAVNFLNSARGAKVAKNWIIMIIASAGILIGTTFSSGMMEVARKRNISPSGILFFRSHDHISCRYVDKRNSS